MTASLPTFTDRNALDRHRRRAVDFGMARFLHDDCAAEVHQRLAEVNRTFTAPAVVTGFPELWSNLLPLGRVVADSPKLDLAEGAHDLVVHALSLHWADDPVGQLVQCRRALKPDGLFLGVMFGGRSLSELRSCLAEAESALTGGLSPRVLPMGEIRDLGSLLQRAGFALPVADATFRKVSYPDAFALMRDLRAMGETNALVARRRKWTRRGILDDAGRRYADAFGLPDGRIAATVETIWLTGWAPSDTQPKPLRPGSAVARLSDALGVPEVPSGDPAKPARD